MPSGGSQHRWGVLETIDAVYIHPRPPYTHTTVRINLHRPLASPSTGWTLHAGASQPPSDILSRHLQVHTRMSARSSACATPAPCFSCNSPGACSCFHSAPAWKQATPFFHAGTILYKPKSRHAGMHARMPTGSSTRIARGNRSPPSFPPRRTGPSGRCTSVHNPRSCRCGTGGKSRPCRTGTPSCPSRTPGRYRRRDKKGAGLTLHLEFAFVFLSSSTMLSRKIRIIRG